MGSIRSLLSLSLYLCWYCTAVGLLVVELYGCGAQPAPQEPDQSISLPIQGGQLAGKCQWPTTVLLSGCTGTLVHPSVVITAGHCGTAHKVAIFGESRLQPARRVPIEYCRTYSNGGSRTATRTDAGTDSRTLRDWAFCKLQQPVSDVQIVPILMGCETDVLKPGQKVVVVGFGDIASDQGGFGTKRWVETTVNKLDTGRGIQVGGMGKAPCYGDSGGPAFVKLADGTWRAFGIDSSGLGSSCALGDEMALMHRAVPWIEQTSGIDITPCHDADGRWNPSPACRGFPMTPDVPGRSWDTACAESGVSGPSATCGSPITVGADTTDAVRDGGVPDGGTVGSTELPMSHPSGGSMQSTGTSGTSGTSDTMSHAGEGVTASADGTDAGHAGSRKGNSQDQTARGRQKTNEAPVDSGSSSNPVLGCSCALSGRSSSDEGTSTVALAVLTLVAVWAERKRHKGVKCVTHDAHFCQKKLC